MFLPTLFLTTLLLDDRLVLNGRGKHIVLVSGDQEYRSEEALPALARILNQHHGFKCTVLYAIDPKDGTINPDINDNIPGLEALDSADLMVIATRFRNLPDPQMRHIADYVKRGRPIVAIRTATHAFELNQGSYRDYSWNQKDGGFGRRVLGETWIRHHGKHGIQSTRGLPADPKHPILRGVKDVWGPSDVYEAHPPADATVLLNGQVLSGMNSTDAPLEGKSTMPIAWTRVLGKQRIFTTTMGGATDFPNDGLRRVVVNACYWAMGLERRIRANSKIAFVREYKPTPFKFGGFIRGLKPGDR